jgi:hypothetical protein
MTMHARLTVCSLALALILGLSGPARTQTKASWQSSESVSVQLTVRDKYGTLGNYEATFIVYTPDGYRLTKSVSVRGDDEGAVTFPQDFTVPSRYIGGVRGGRYRWECIVLGKAVVGGSFTVATTYDPIPARHGKGLRSESRR